MKREIRKQSCLGGEKVLKSIPLTEELLISFDMRTLSIKQLTLKNERALRDVLQLCVGMNEF